MINNDDLSGAADLKEKQNLNGLEHDIFDLKRLRLTQDFAGEIAVKKLILTVPLRKPNRQEFIRTRSGEAWRFQTCVLTLKEERETYLVDRDLWTELPGEIIPTMLFTAINRQGVLSLWPVRLPSGDGRLDNWNKSAFEAAEVAQSAWIRLAANLSLGAYELHKAQGDMPEPEWPDISFEEILRIALKDRVVQDVNHPVVKRLRGLQ